MPRPSSISSTSRRLSGNRKYNQTAWAMIWGGNRGRLQLTGLVIVRLLNHKPPTRSYRDITGSTPSVFRSSVGSTRPS